MPARRSMPFYGALHHELRNTSRLPSERHLLIPGFVFTGPTSTGRTEKPTDAWTPEQTVEFMIERVAAGGSATPNTRDKSIFPGIGLTCHFIAGATFETLSFPALGRLQSTSVDPTVAPDRALLPSAIGCSCR